jgi:hypothetical protein
MNSLNVCKIYEQVLVFFLLLPPLRFSAAPPTAHRWHFPRPPAAPSPLFLRHLAPLLARPPLNRPCWLLLAQTRRTATRLSRHAHRRPLAAACRTPLFSLGTCSVNFSFLLLPHAHPHSYLNPNSICHIAIFIHFCEAFLGIEPHWDLFRFFFG